MWRPTFQENVLSQDTPEPRQASWRRDLLLALSVLVAVFLIVFRMPDLIPGRIWAEEASYFATAYEFGWVKGLTQVHGEYVNLPANLAATAAQFLALEDAPKASLLLALLFQCLPAIVLLTLRIPWLSAPQHSVVAVLLTILTPLSEETWLNSINSQVYLTVCVGLILMARPRGGAAGFFHVAVLLMAILSGPAPAFAAPLYLLRSLQDRSGWRWAQTAALSAGAMLQVSLVLLQLRVGRELDFTPYLLVCIIYSKHILAAIYGRLHADELSRDLLHYIDGGHVAFVPLVAVAMLFGFLAWGVLASKRSDLAWLLAFAIVLILGTYFGAFGKKINLIHTSTGARYAVAPGILLALVAFGIARTAAGYTRAAATAMLAWLLVAGAWAYFRPDPQAAHGPDWRSEVQAWRHDPSAPLQVWPRGWAMHLPRTARREAAL